MTARRARDRATAIWQTIRFLLPRSRNQPSTGPVPCPASEAWVLQTWFAGNHARRVLRHMPIEEGMRVLDVGCGVGRFSIPLAHRVGPDGSVTALDLQDEMLDILRQQVAEEGLGNIRTVQAPAGEAGVVEPGSHDVVLLASVLGEVPAPERVPVLRQASVDLVDGGALYVVEVSLFDPDYLTAEAVGRLGSAAGLSVAQVIRILPGYLLRFEKATRTPQTT